MFDMVSFVIALESGELDHDETVAGIQSLIDSGLVWNLQGSYGRLAMRLIESGDCHHAIDPAVHAHVQKQEQACGRGCSD